MIAGILPRNLGKADAVMRLASVAGVSEIDPWGDDVASVIDRISVIVPPCSNLDLTISPSKELPTLQSQLHHSAATRELALPNFLNGRPNCFPRAGENIAYSPSFSVLPIPNGYIGNFVDGFMTFIDRKTVIADSSSRYSQLVKYYDANVDECLNRAEYINGTVVPIFDDIRPLNFSHWLIDWLPRLEFLGASAFRSDVYVATTPIFTEYQLTTLEMCGFDRTRVIELDKWQAVQARQLLVPSCLHKVPHPGYKTAPWVVNFLRSRIGINALLKAESSFMGGYEHKIYVSRSDAFRRRVLNEPELSAALAHFNYRTVNLSDKMSFSEQASIFARASHIIGLHGAGLTNFVFTREKSQLIEIFPRSYGTPAFYVVAAGTGSSYACFVAENISSEGPTQYDDVIVDVPEFIKLSAEIL